jgi:hypothetical protein
MADLKPTLGLSDDGSIQVTKRIWYRTTLFNAFIIGGVGFMAPGLWNAMNSLGAGGAESPFLINAANALVFGLSMPFGLLWISKTNTHNYDLTSGVPMSFWWPDRKSHWHELDPFARCSRISGLFVGDIMLLKHRKTNSLIGVLERRYTLTIAM